MTPEEYASYDGLGLADLVRRREVSAVELVEHAMAQIERLNPRLNAVICKLYERARTEAAGTLADGPFTGVPFLLKDLDGLLRGAPYTGGSRAYVGYLPDHDSEIIVRLRRAGLIVLGKTNTPEAGILGITEPLLHGPTRNPWHLDYTSGGSSGGSAAAVAARMVPLAHGADGGGSIRIPASACGLFGLKPTRGRNPVGPDAGEGWNGLVCPHVLTRSVRDSAAVLDAVSGLDPGAPYVAPASLRPYLEEVTRLPGKLRIAFSTASLLGHTTHSDCVAAVDDAAQLCAELGHDVVAAAPVIDKAVLARAYLTVVASGTAGFVAEAARLAGKRIGPEHFEPSTWFLAQVGQALSAYELEQARTAMHRASRTLAEFHAHHDLFLTATMAYPPVRVGELALKPGELLGLGLLRRLPMRKLLMKALDDLAQGSLERTANTMVFNETGQPAMSVPLFWNAQGLPIGVQFVGRFGDEATLLRLAGQLEQARPWMTRTPGVL